jgi:hypothetical protein
MNRDHERSFGLRNVEICGGVVQHLDQAEQVRLNQSECGRPVGSSPVGDRGGDAQRLEHLRGSW